MFGIFVVSSLNTEVTKDKWVPYSAGLIPFARLGVGIKNI
jgi:hypothetical protein